MIWHSDRDLWPRIRRPLCRRAAVLLVVFGLAFAAVPLEAATYYVATTGSDARSCATAQTISTPKQTINGARNCPAPGDRVLIRAGTYVEELDWRGGPRGTSWANPITFAAYPGESVTVRPNVGASRVLSLVNTSTGVDNASQYLIFDGLAFDGTNVLYDVVHLKDWDGLTLGQGGFPSRHLRFTHFHFFMVAGHQYNGIVTEGPDVQLIHGEIDHLGLTATGGSSNSQGVYGAGGQMLIDDVSIHDIFGYGISNVNSFDFTAVHDDIIRNCRIYNNLDGINVGQNTGNLVYNNLVYNNTNHGIYVHAFGAGSGSGTGVYNNTVYGNGLSSGYPGISVAADETSTVIRNNIAYGNAQNYQNTRSGTIEDHNLFAGDPLFVKAGAGDFHLQSGSPATDKGMTLSEVATDLDGAPRPQGAAYDIGAYEFVGGAQQPSRPTAVRVIP